MGLSVILETNTGNRLEELHDPKMLLNGTLPDPEDRAYEVWRFIDPYGYTILNGVQMSALKNDLQRLRDSVNDEETLVLLKHIREMADKCASEPHLYLRFIGD